MESCVATEPHFVVGPGMGLAVGLTNVVDTDPTDVVDLMKHLVDLCSFESLGFDLPDRKSLLKNPCFSTFCSTDNVLSVSVTAREIFTEGDWISPLFNNDECGGVCSDWKRGAFILAVDAKATDVGSGPNCGSRNCLLRAGLLFEVTRTPPSLPSGRSSTSVLSA